MSLELYAHPFSSYCWKVLIALWENEVPFDYRSLAEPENMAALDRLCPTGKLPLLMLDGEPLFETSIMIEQLQRRFGGPVRLIPDDEDAALEVRLMDRMFDLNIQSPYQAIVGEHLPFITDQPDPKRITRAQGQLERIYPWFDQRLAGRRWAAGDQFTMADCAGAPAVFYADWIHPIPKELANLHAYRSRVLERPSVARAVNEARPFRHLFPLGAPDRD